MKQLKYITPQFYHQWLEDCPIKWERIEDNITTQTIKFFLPLEGESNNNSGKVYPEVDDVPEQVYQDWLYNKEEITS